MTHNAKMQLLSQCKSAPLETMTMAAAKEWVEHMENADGTSGGKWTPAQTSKVLETKGWSCDPAEFYAAMCMMYSDYGTLAEKFKANQEDFCAELAKAFLCDADAVEHKIEAYREFVSKG